MRALLNDNRPGGEAKSAGDATLAEEMDLTTKTTIQTTVSVPTMGTTLMHAKAAELTGLPVWMVMKVWVACIDHLTNGEATKASKQADRVISKMLDRSKSQPPRL